MSPRLGSFLRKPLIRSSPVSNRIANWYLSLGVKPMENVAILFENKPELLFHVLALWKIGAVPAMQNYNLRGKSLTHCLSIVKPRYLVFGDDEAETAGEISEDLSSMGIQTFHWTTGAADSVTKATKINMNELASFADGPIDRSIRKDVGWDDTGMII